VNRMRKLGAHSRIELSFAPTNGEFKGVRTFAQQLKHVATLALSRRTGKQRKR
jgi:hypothetical protein